MTWRDDFRPASWRGVAFHVEAHDRGSGHSQETHLFPRAEASESSPERPDHYVEDLGREPDLYQVEGYVVGDDYLTAAAELDAAMRQPGAGTLVHPYLGELTVKPSTWRRREDRREGGLARFTLNFTEPGRDSNPAPRVDTQAQVDLAADRAVVLTEARFVETYEVEGRPGFLAEAACGILQEAAAAADRVLQALPPGVQAAGSVALDVALFALDVAQSGPGALLRDPVALAARTSGVTAGLAGLPTTAQSDAAGLTTRLRQGDLGPLRSLTEFGGQLAPVAAVTATRLQQGLNQQALVSLVRQAATIGLTRSARDVLPASYDDAVRLRDSLDGLLEAQITDAGDRGDDAAFEALSELRGRMVADLTTRAANLVRIVPRVLRQAQPALVLAYDLYEDALRDAELAARNGIRHPGYLPGGRDLETLGR